MTNEERIKSELQIPQYFNECIYPYKSGLRRLGKDSMSTICPFHEDTDPSLHYWPESDTFFCFGCKASGDVISMHILNEKRKGRYISKDKAIEELGKIYDIELELDEKGNVKVESVFEKAKKRNQGTSTSTPSISIAKFRLYNNQIKSSVRGYMSGEQICKMYSELDLKLSEQLAVK